MKKWTKPLLAIIILLAVGGSCFCLGDRLGYNKGYEEGMAYQALMSSKNSAHTNVLLLKMLRRRDILKEELMIESILESDVLSIASLSKFDDADGKILMKDVADYIRKHPFKKKPEPIYQKLIDDFINKYDPK